MLLILYLNYCRLIFRIRSIMRSLIKKSFYTDVDVQVVIKKAIQKGSINKVLQIGSNDGLKNDPLNFWINNFNLNVILVEPFDDNFQKLIKNYSFSKSNIHFEKAGISDRNEEREYYYLRDIQSNEPNWYDQVGSFDYGTFLSNISVNSYLINRIGRKKIICKKLETLLLERDWKTLDFLHIDAEGFDYTILKSIDFNTLRPKFILFETDWMKIYEYKNLKDILIANQYSIFMSGIDCLAISNSILKPFKSIFKK
jgi:FkbM family methyltransferase